MSSSSIFPVGMLGQVPFALTTVSRAVAWLLDAAEAHRGVAIRLSNAYCVALTEQRSDYAALFSDGVTFPDGLPAVQVLRFLGHKDAHRVRGPSLFVDTLEASRGRQVSHYFLGSSASTINGIAKHIALNQPNLRIAGMHSPPFGELSQELLDEWVAMISVSDASLVWVSLGTPKQDFAASALASRLNRPVVAVGAAFDFLAGSAIEAPRWMQQSGLEWAFRLATEPKRLWKRYLVGNLIFVKASARQILWRLTQGRTR